jgi:ParB family chromosome partitioning protein
MPTRINRYLESISTFENLEIHLIKCSQTPLRDSFDDLEDLVGSIRVHGLLQPILVRPVGEGFEVVAGNRRFEACKKLKHRKIKSVVVELDDKSAYEIAITENVQRKTLDPLEEGLAFKRYCEEFGWGSETELARRIGKSQEYVSHRIKLLTLPEEVKDALREKKIPLTSAEELMWMREDEEKKKVAKFIANEKLSMSEVRNLVKTLNSIPSPKANLISETLTPRLNEEQAFFIPPYKSKGDYENVEFSKITSELILILRIALVRIDDLVAKTRDAKLKQLVMSKRVELHKIIDDLILARKRGALALPELVRARNLSNSTRN